MRKRKQAGMRLLPGAERGWRRVDVSSARNHVEEKEVEGGEGGHYWMTNTSIIAPPLPLRSLRAPWGGDDTVSRCRKESQRHTASIRPHLANEYQRCLRPPQGHNLYLNGHVCCSRPRFTHEASDGFLRLGSLLLGQNSMFAFETSENPLQDVKNALASGLKRDRFFQPVNNSHFLKGGGGWSPGIKTLILSNNTVIRTMGLTCLFFH